MLALAGLLGVLADPAGAAGRASPSMTITASTSTIVGLQVFANVNLTGGANPSGTITFKLFAPADASCTAPIFTTATAVSGVAMNSQRFTTSAAGTYRWQATYSGDTSNNGYGPTACSNPSASVIVSPASTGLSISAPPPSSGAIHATAILGGFKPTGTITFLLSPPGDVFCSLTPVFSSTAAVSTTGSYSSASYNPTVTGTYKWRATYSGDVNNNRAGPTACLDPNASMTVTSITATAPPKQPPATTSPTTAKPTAATSTTPPTALAGPAAAIPAAGATAAAPSLPASTTTSTASSRHTTPPPRATLGAVHTAAGARHPSYRNLTLAVGAATIALAVTLVILSRRTPRHPWSPPGKRHRAREL